MLLTNNRGRRRQKPMVQGWWRRDIVKKMMGLIILIMHIVALSHTHTAMEWMVSLFPPLMTRSHTKPSTTIHIKLQFPLLLSLSSLLFSPPPQKTFPLSIVIYISFSSLHGNTTTSRCYTPQRQYVLHISKGILSHFLSTLIIITIIIQVCSRLRSTWIKAMMVTTATATAAAMMKTVKEPVQALLLVVDYGLDQGMSPQPDLKMKHAPYFYLNKNLFLVTWHPPQVNIHLHYTLYILLI